MRGLSKPARSRALQTTLVTCRTSLKKSEKEVSIQGEVHLKDDEKGRCVHRRERTDVDPDLAAWY